MSAGSDAPVITVMTVDDHPFLREGLAAILNGRHDIKLVAEVGDGIEAVEKFREVRPDITLMDLQMPRLGGIDAITQIRSEFPAARIIVLTTYEGDAQALRALKAGAVGYLLKSSARKELVETIRNVHAGRRHIPPAIAQEIAFRVTEEPLSDREIAVLQLVAAGNANKRIAWRLSVSEDTVKAHMKSIFGKLDAEDRAHAVAMALKRGIIAL